MLVLYGHCSNSFTPPSWQSLTPPDNVGKKAPQIILASLYTPPPYGQCPYMETTHFKKRLSLAKTVLFSVIIATELPGICLSFMIFSTFIIFLITKLVQELEAELLGGFDPLVCSCRWSRLYLHLDTYPSKINNMQNNSKLHLRAPSKRGCLCTGSTCTSCPARVPPWCLLPTTSSSTFSS